MSRRMVLVSMVLGALMLPAMVVAQERPQGERSSDRGGDRARGGFDRSRFEGFIKEQLGVNDEEWKVIQPKIEKVNEARRDASGFGSFFGRGPRGGDENREKSAAQKASEDLRETLDKKDSSADEISKKLTALREARTKAKEQLASAQKDLKDVLTARQEATMVMLGMLE